MLNITCKTVPVQAANMMSIVERYHAPLLRAFTIIGDDCTSLEYDDVLLAAVKSLNDSTGLDGLIPTLLAFGAMPRLGTRQDPLIRTQLSVLRQSKKRLKKCPHIL